MFLNASAGIRMAVDERVSECVHVCMYKYVRRIDKRTGRHTDQTMRWTGRVRVSDLLQVFVGSEGHQV